MMRLVYVHLGTAKCEHLLSSIERTHSLFPDYEIHLVTSTNFSQQKIPPFINHHVYSPSIDTEEMFQQYGHDTTFRQGFWRFSLERLFAIKVVHDEHPNDSILHIESDVLFLPNFPIEEIARSTSLMWNPYNENHDVSAILFSPYSNMTDQLLIDIRVRLQRNPKLTDMTVLNEIWRTSDMEIKHFSFTNPIFPEMINPLSTPFQGSDEGVGYGGIFDGAAIGMWLLGHDPKNNYGKSTLHSRSVIESGNSHIDPSALRYEMDGNGHLYAVSQSLDGVRIPIWNLHVHSKNLKLLSLDWLPELRKFVELSATKQEIVHMDWGVVWRMLSASLISGTFLQFLLGIPQLQPVRRRISPVKKKIIDRGKATFSR